MTNSAMSTLCVLYTPHFLHSRIQSTLQSMFSTFHTPRFPQFTLHYTALSLPLLPSPSRAVSRPNSLLLLPRVRSRARIPFPFPVERLPRRLHRTPRFPQSTLFVFHTLHYTALSLPRPSLLPRAPSRAQIPYTSSLARDLAPKFPSTSISNACHVGLTALLAFHTRHSCFYRQPFILPVKSTFLNLSAD